MQAPFLNYNSVKRSTIFSPFSSTKTYRSKPRKVVQIPYALFLPQKNTHIGAKKKKGSPLLPSQKDTSALSPGLTLQANPPPLPPNHHLLDWLRRSIILPETSTLLMKQKTGNLWEI